VPTLDRRRRRVKPGGARDRHNRTIAEAAAAPTLTGRTAWARTLALPVREFLSAEVGSAVVLLAATIAALLWANAAPHSYDTVWTTDLSIRLGRWGIAQDLREWVNNGLMVFFFFVVGLEARREFDMGELRERRRVALPVVAALGGMVVPILIFLAFNAGRASAHGWGTTMSTDTAFALGALALVGRGCPGRLRTFLLTLVVVDDVVALVVIGTAYTHNVAFGALAVGIALFGVALVLRHAGVRRGLVYLGVGSAMWVAVYESGVDPVIVGLALGLMTSAYPAMRSDLERATELFRSFREQPTPELAREARLGVDFAISPNERMQQLLHPWTSFVIVPLFALANAGIEIDGSFLRSAATSPITLGILVGYVVGKPLGIVGASWVATRPWTARLRRPVGWPALTGAGSVAGIGFTVSLLIASLAFHGAQLEEAKLGVLAAAGCATLLSWLVFRVIRALPASVQARGVVGTTAPIVDLDEPVDVGRDHVRGPEHAPVTLLEYGDFECPYCGRAEPVIRELVRELGDDVRFVFRHLPLSDVHPRAQIAAEAAEAAAAQGAFWEMHDKLLDHQDELRPVDLMRYAGELGLDTDRFMDELRRHVYAPRVTEDVDSADRSGVSGTPTFFVNGRRHQGAYDLATLTRAVQLAHTRARAGA
jgi:Na+/H+ antiporter NhaA